MGNPVSRSGFGKTGLGLSGLSGLVMFLALAAFGAPPPAGPAPVIPQVTASDDHSGTPVAGGQPGAPVRLIRPVRKPRPAAGPASHRVFTYQGHAYPLAPHAPDAASPGGDGSQPVPPATTINNIDYSGLNEGDTNEPPPQNEAIYEVIDRRGRQSWVDGHYEEVAAEERVPGQSVEVYHPAVYRQKEGGVLELMEKEKIRREPKVRIILRKVWVEGHYEANRSGARKERPPVNPGGTKPKAPVVDENHPAAPEADENHPALP